MTDLIHIDKVIAHNKSITRRNKIYTAIGYAIVSTLLIMVSCICTLA